MSSSLTPASESSRANGHAGAVLAGVAVDQDAAGLSVGDGTQ